MAIALNSSTLVTVFGGSGFLGRHVVQALARTGCRVRVAVRRPDLAGFLQPLGGLGQIHAVQANLRYEASIRRAVEGADGVINLVAILQQSGKQTFKALQGVGAGLVARAAREGGARALGPCVGDRRQPAEPFVLRAHQGGGRGSGPPSPFRAPSFCGPRSSSARRTTSSTASPRWGAFRPSCR